MANIFTLWSGGNNFTDEDGWSSSRGALSYRGVLMGLSYRSEALDQRIVVTTHVNKHLIRLKRRMFIVPENVLRQATNAVMQRKYSEIPTRLPPYHWDARAIEILSPHGILRDWYDFIARLMVTGGRRFIVITFGKPNEITSAMISTPFIWANRRVYTTSNEHDITLFKLMSDSHDIIIDTDELCKQLVRYYGNVRDGNIENLLASKASKIAKLLAEELNNI